MAGYIPYSPSLTEKAGENRKTPTLGENKLWRPIPLLPEHGRRRNIAMRALGVNLPL
ncbi:MAG: hypothetical protein Q8R28_17880 [Dehalococcoidia bacterium]|nr:hypothetical protein [Dehalococcoidia bacterium]